MRQAAINACTYDPGLAVQLRLTPDPAYGSYASLIAGMDEAGIATSLVVLAELTDEFRSVQAAGRFYALAHYNSEDPRRGLDALRAMCEREPDVVRGVATAFPCYGQDPRLNDFGPLYKYCIERRLPVVIRLTAPAGGPAIRPVACAVLAALYPELHVVCLDEDGRGTELASVLPKYPRLFLATRAAGLADLQSLVSRVGSRRMMFATGETRMDATEVRSLRRLPFYQRNHVAWRTATRLFTLPPR